MNLQELTHDLDELLSNGEIEDYKNAINGLQVENTGKIKKISVAVDACEHVLKEAILNQSQLLIVHHGLFWNGIVPVVGPSYRKMKLALTNDLAIYSSHLPLDAHPLYGNNALFADKLNLPPQRHSFLQIGLRVETEIPLEVLCRRAETAVGGRVHLASGGPPVAHKIGIITGGAGSEIFKAAAAGVDTFITGEGPHWSFTAAEELGINLIYAGHYATETFGVKALGSYLEGKYRIPWEFIDHPTGL